MSFDSYEKKSLQLTHYGNIFPLERVERVKGTYALPFNRVSESAPETYGGASQALRLSGADSLAAAAAFPIAFTGLLIGW